MLDFVCEDGEVVVISMDRLDDNSHGILNLLSFEDIKLKKLINESCLRNSKNTTSRL